MYKLAATYTRAAKVISQTCGFLAAIAVVFMTLLTVSDVFRRYFFNKPILGSFELTEYLLVVVVFLAIPWATMEGVHVRVDLITQKISRRPRAVLYAVSCLLSMFITALIAWFTIPEAKYAYELQEKSDMLNIPTYPFYFLIAVCFFILLFIMIAVFLQHIEEAVRK